MDFYFIQEPYLSEVVTYLRQRRDHIPMFATLADVRAELTRHVTANIQPLDSYPKARLLIADDEYVSILKDMFNLSNVLDDMEQTGTVPYHQRGPFYNVYSRLYRLLTTKSKALPA